MKVPLVDAAAGLWAGVVGRVRAAVPGPGIRPKPAAPPAVQGWLPVRDVRDGVLARADGGIVAAVRVEPAPFGLLSEGERGRRIVALHEALAGLPGPVQIVSVPRPVDLDAYIAGLVDLQSSASGPRRSLLAGYLRYVRELAGGGEAVERRFHVLLIDGSPHEGAAAELRQRAAEFAAALGRAELAAHVCDGAELTDLIFCFLHPLRAAFERAIEPVVAPRYVPPLEGVPDGPR